MFDIQEWPLLFISQLCLIIQLLTHTPFIYYIAKEQFLMAYDEYNNHSISLMVDRVINEQGDPRFYLAQLKTNTDENISKGAAQKVVFLHRLPHMKLNEKKLRYLNLRLYALMILMSSLGIVYYQFFDRLFSLGTALVSAVELFIIPGTFYFWKNKARWLREDVDVHKYILFTRSNLNKILEQSTLRKICCCCLKQN